jgi:regulatory protein
MAAPRSAAERRSAAETRRARRAEVTDSDVVMEAATAFLAVRPRSVSEVRRRLRYLGYQATLTDGVVDRLVELGYLDDHAFATAWVESRDRARPRGTLALRRELALKGIDRAVAEGVLAERTAVATERTTAEEQDEGRPRLGRPTDAADLQAAAHLLRRRAGSFAREPDPRRRQQRAYALLARHGFTPDVCRQAVLAVLDAAIEQPADA